jgi:ATP-dependent helicase HrpA
MQESKSRVGMNDEHDARLREFRWQLEELRVALFAQELKTPMPMSVKRLEKVLASLR